MAWGIPDLTAFLTDDLGLTLLGTDDEAEQLEVGLSGGEADEVHPTTLRLAGSVAEARVLWVDVRYPFTAPDLDAARIAGARLHPYLALGHTEVDDDGSLHHRYAMPVDTTSPLPAGLLAQALSVLSYEQVHFGDYLEALCRGDVEVDLFAELVARGEAAELG
ncbi:hypothetical protein GCM10023340_41100 [Nocardioides marinquilinus]|uniref:YbjN domain-containing protein n=1 Tax=Nocardioides marinquilinus TaxID=1210400 RepID=A0ABP9Q1Y9_9ACTN